MLAKVQGLAQLCANHLKIRENLLMSIYKDVQKQF